MHYLERYIKFIKWCTEANKNISASIYTEEHHIAPKAKDLFPEYSKADKKFVKGADPGEGWARGMKPRN